MLYVKEYGHRSISFGSIFGSLGSSFDEQQYRGMHNWHASLNLLMLRLISFNLDYYWSLDRRPSSLLIWVLTHLCKVFK